MSDIPNIGTPKAAVMELGRIATDTNEANKILTNALFDLCQAAVFSAMNNKDNQLMAAVRVAREAIEKVGK